MPRERIWNCPKLARADPLLHFATFWRWAIPRDSASTGFAGVRQRQRRVAHLQSLRNRSQHVLLLVQALRTCASGPLLAAKAGEAERSTPTEGSAVLGSRDPAGSRSSTLGRGRMRQELLALGTNAPAESTLRWLAAISLGCPVCGGQEGGWHATPATGRSASIGDGTTVAAGETAP